MSLFLTARMCCRSLRRSVCASCSSKGFGELRTGARACLKACPAEADCHLHLWPAHQRLRACTLME